MARYLRPVASLILISLLFSRPASTVASAGPVPAPEPDGLRPDNTVVVANARDARFTRDFSVLLKHLRVPWIVLDGPDLPEDVQDKHVILVGHPEARHTGELLRAILTADETATLTAATDHHVILERPSPWHTDRTVVVCAGADLVRTRNAAEAAVRAIVEAAPPASDWIRTTYDIEVDADLRDELASALHTWDDAELSVDELTMDVEAKSARRVSADQAVDDVARLFYLLSHGYAGYGYYNRRGQFAQAEADILREIATKRAWTNEALSTLLHQHLGFIVDCHLTIGNHKYGGHADFWYDTRLELLPGDDGFVFQDRGAAYTVVSIDGTAPEPFLHPSLNAEGAPFYRLGVLSSGKPSPLVLTVVGAGGERQIEVTLKRSNFEHFAQDIFREDSVGGIPVIRARSFGDSYTDQLSAFTQTGSSRRGDPVVILDLRGNGGGNERWPVEWIRRLTGRRAESIFVFSELESVTSMMGRANVFRHYLSKADIPGYDGELEQATATAKAIATGARQPGWTSPTFPAVPLIANDTTVVVVTNDLVASAGEGLVMRISQVENVVVVGENTMGALTFGNVALHRLPNSGMRVWMPINMGLFPDLAMREGIGLAPDLWVPAADAVNYAVAALRAGTITTVHEIPRAALDQRFVRESRWSRLRTLGTTQWLVVAAFLLVGVVFCVINRKRARMLLGAGVLWLPIGLYWATRSDKPELGLAFLGAGALYLIWGGVALATRRSNPEAQPAGEDPREGEA